MNSRFNVKRYTKSIDCLLKSTCHLRPKNVRMRDIIKKYGVSSNFSTVMSKLEIVSKVKTGGVVRSLITRQPTQKNAKLIAEIVNKYNLLSDYNNPLQIRRAKAELKKTGLFEFRSDSPVKTQPKTIVGTPKVITQGFNKAELKKTGLFEFRSGGPVKTQPKTIVGTPKVITQGFNKPKFNKVIQTNLFKGKIFNTLDDQLKYASTHLKSVNDRDLALGISLYTQELLSRTK